MSCPNRLLLPASGLAAGLLCAALPAQETPPPPTPPPPVEATYALAFKHKTAGLQKFKGTTKVDAAISPEGGPARLSPLPITSNAVLTFTEKVIGTRRGTGTLNLTLSSLVSTTTDPLGNKEVNRFQNGKISASRNGQPVSEGSSRARAAALAEFKKPLGFRRDPTGVITPIGKASDSLSALFGSPTFTIVQVPAMPVKVGDTWETTQRIRPTVLGGSGPFVIPEIEFRYTHTLKRIDVRGGKKQALIESSGSGSTLGEGADNTLNQNITGVTRFDIDRGAVVSSQYNIILGLRLGIPPGAEGAVAGLTGVRVDGSIDVVVMELPVAPPKKKR